MQRLKNADENGNETGLRLLDKPAVNPSCIPTTPPRSQRLCGCGCGDWFVPTRNSHVYVNRKHSQERFINDKKDALLVFLEALMIEHGASARSASKKAVECVDFWFAAFCKSMARCGYVYDTKAKVWTMGKVKV